MSPSDPSLEARTLAALDWPAVLQRLAHHARTQRGAAAAVRPRLEADLEGVRRRYAEVAEVAALEDEGRRLPIGGVADVGAVAERASRGIVLEPADLIAVRDSLVALEALKAWIVEADSPALRDLVEPIELDWELVQKLKESFDEAGELSVDAYPGLGVLRGRIASLKRRIRSTLDELIKGDALSDALQDRYVTERGGRFVIPVKAGHRRGLGIVHGTSQSGETVYVEPAAVVEQANELRETEGRLQAEERRILSALSALVGRFHAEIEEALEASVNVDHAVARAELGRELEGVEPEVGHKGVVALKQALHPVLALRGIPVVANDLNLDASQPGLVLTGPNTGGKTIALKTIGLSALFVASGVPVPCDEGSRVDLFPTVLADIGDAQSVESDLSTFSGQVMVLREVLERASPGTLVLLDEIAVGTDPSQGAALARAAVEALVEVGARVVVTTHYAELKALGTQDERFCVAAAQYANGRPTYRLEPGLAGQSYAISTARRLGLPGHVLERAEGLLDGAELDLAKLLEELEEEKERVRAKEVALSGEQAALARKVREVEARAEKLRARSQRLQEELERTAGRRLKEQEDALRAVVAELQRNPDMAKAQAALAGAKELRAALRPAPVAPPPAPKELAVGDAVWVTPLGKPGLVVAIDGNRVEVQVGKLRTKVKKKDLGGAGRRYVQVPQKAPVQAASKPEKKAQRPPSEDFHGVRVDSNSLDLRGKRVDEAMEAAEVFLDALTLGGHEVGFLLHGHGTGALKTAIRRWLPRCRYARRWRPCYPDEGGDAWTIVELA